MRVLSPILAGRDDELVALHHCLALAGEGSTALLISGEAGIGKSRLLREAMAIAAAGGWAVLQGNCFEQDRASPFAPFVDLLFRAEPGQLVTDRFLALAPQLLKLTPDLMPAFPTVILAPLAEPEQEQRDLMRAWTAWLAPPRLAAGRPPTLLIIEDLHWCDELSLELLLRLARAATERSLVLLLSYRNDEAAPALSRLLAHLDRERLANELALRPLSPDAIGAMIRAIFNQAGPISGEFVAAMDELTEGNPFFVEEVLQSLVNTGDIYSDRARAGISRTPVETRVANVPRSDAPARDFIERRNPNPRGTGNRTLEGTSSSIHKEIAMSGDPSQDHTTYRPIPYAHRWLEPEEQLAASRGFLDIMARRRTIRDFAATPVPFELIENAIRAAALAPSGANQQPWFFVVISDPERKRQIREAAEAEERESYARRMPQEWLDALAPLGTDWQKPHLTQAPYLIVVFEQVYGVKQGPDGEERVKHYYVKESVGIAVGVLLAALTHMGLATLTHTPSPMGFLTTLLGRPANERPYVLIPVGYPADGATVPAITKKPLEQLLVHLAAPGT
jgi:iodotyrosine deiodinase